MFLLFTCSSKIASTYSRNRCFLIHTWCVLKIHFIKRYNKCFATRGTMFQVPEVSKLFPRREVILVGINVSRRWTATFRADSCSFSETSLRDNCKKVHARRSSSCSGENPARRWPFGYIATRMRENKGDASAMPDVKLEITSR